jgi:hypothetical protein
LEQRHALIYLDRPHSQRDQAGVSHLPSPSHLRRQGPRARLDPVLQAVQVHPALPPARCSTRGRKLYRHPINRTRHANIQSRVARTASPRKSAASSTVFTSASSAPAAAHLALHTGGTARSTSAPPSSCSRTAGSPTRVTRRPHSAWTASTTA